MHTINRQAGTTTSGGGEVLEVDYFLGLVNLTI
jgi:hypothetical protein